MADCWPSGWPSGQKDAVADKSRFQTVSTSLHHDRFNWRDEIRTLTFAEWRPNRTALNIFSHGLSKRIHTAGDHTTHSLHWHRLQGVQSMGQTRERCVARACNAEDSRLFAPSDRWTAESNHQQLQTNETGVPVIKLAEQSGQFQNSKIVRRFRALKILTFSHFFSLFLSFVGTRFENCRNCKAVNVRRSTDRRAVWLGASVDSNDPHRNVPAEAGQQGALRRASSLKTLRCASVCEIQSVL